jgi:ribosomal protein S4
MPSLSPMARLRRAKATGPSDYNSLADQFSDLLDYVKAHPEACDEDLYAILERRRDHALFRAQLKPERWARLIEIASRRQDYAVYAQGWMSMVKDALL